MGGWLSDQTDGQMGKWVGFWEPLSRQAGRCTGGLGGALPAAPTPLTMRQLTSMRRGPRLVYLPSTWNTPCESGTGSGQAGQGPGQPGAGGRAGREG